MSRHLRKPEHRHRDFLIGVITPALVIIAAGAVLISGLLALV